MNINLLNPNLNCLNYYKKNNIHLKGNANTTETYKTTAFFRDDFDWLGFFNLLNHTYKDAKKVNIVSYGCSNGKETYSLALGLKTFLNKKSDKFLPLIAKDIDKNCVLKAKKGLFKISNNEERKLETYSNYQIYRYINIFDDGLEKYAKVKDTLKQHVCFEKADICEDIKNIPPDNTVLICRNFWGYLDGKKQMELVNTLTQKLNYNSLIVIGEFDKNYQIHQLLEARGFKETEIPCVFRKIK